MDKLDAPETTLSVTGPATLLTVGKGRPQP